MSDVGSAAEVVEQLRGHQDDDELPKVRSRLAPDEAAIGMAMRDLFAVAKAHRNLALDEVEILLDRPEYEARMAAFCILDFKARRRLTADDRRELYELYLARHDRITTWDMVDRAAPHVVGGHLVGRSPAPLHDLAAADDPLRRRTAITAPLYFVGSGSDADLDVGYAVAAELAPDPDPTVHRAVGIYLKHAGSRDERRLTAFLDDHAGSMPRAAVRLATEKLEPEVRARYR